MINSSGEIAGNGNTRNKAPDQLVVVASRVSGNFVLEYSALENANNLRNSRAIQVKVEVWGRKFGPYFMGRERKRYIIRMSLRDVLALTGSYELPNRLGAKSNWLEQQCKMGERLAPTTEGAQLFSNGDLC